MPAQPSLFSSNNPPYQAFAQVLGVQWIWIWDPRIVRWEVVNSPLLAAPIRGYNCDYCWSAQVTRGAGPALDGARAMGTYIWLRDPPRA